MRNRMSRLARPFAVASSLILCGGCASVGGAEPYCPEPTHEEVEDFNSLVLENPTRPTVFWVSRLIGYCWPREAEEARRAADATREMD